jgi:hypothetical protein
MVTRRAAHRPPYFHDTLKLIEFYIPIYILYPTYATRTTPDSTV